MITSVDYKSLKESISLIISGGTQALNVSDLCVVVRMKKYTNSKMYKTSKNACYERKRFRLIDKPYK